jgi:hypothetical protein
MEATIALQSCSMENEIIPELPRKSWHIVRSPIALAMTAVAAKVTSDCRTEFLGLLICSHPRERSRWGPRRKVISDVLQVLCGKRVEARLHSRTEPLAGLEKFKLSEEIGYWQSVEDGRAVRIVHAVARHAQLGLFLARWKICESNGHTKSDRCGKDWQVF